MPQTKANGTSHSAILNEDGLHHGLNHAIPMMDDTDLEMQQIPNKLNTTATAGMLCTRSSIGRSFESNNFTIADHLEEDHKQGGKTMTIHQSEAANFGIYKKS